MLYTLFSVITVLLVAILTVLVLLVTKKPARTDAKERKKNFFSLHGTLKLTYLAVFTALSIVAGTYQIPMGSTNVSLSYIPTFLAGAFFGPVAGFVVGALGDLLGAVLQGFAPLLPLSLGNGMIGALMGLAFLLPTKHKAPRIVIGAIASLLIVTLGINAVTLWHYYGAGRSFWMYLTLPADSLLPRIVMQPIVLAINTAITVPLYYALERTLFKRFRR